jgi:tetratricopeptide (TPR) repeat protein
MSLAMDEAENNLENNPEISLAILDSISSKKLTNGAESARYALLKSIALDKNYIDTTSFNVLKPALDYYPKHGSAKELQKTYYYQGRIFQNRGDYDNAMKCFIESLDFADKTTDSLTMARTLVAQSIIFKSVYNIAAFTNNQLTAAWIYQNLGKKEQRMDCLLNALDGSLLLNNKDQADSIYQICYQEQHQVSSDFLAYQLSYYLQFGSNKQIVNIIDKVVNSSDLTANDSLNLANAFDKICKYDDALKILHNIHCEQAEFDQLKYEAILVSVYEHMGNSKDALLTYKLFSHRLDSIHSILFEGKIQFSNERHQLELEAHKAFAAKKILIWKGVGIVVFLLMTIITLLLVIRSNRSQKALAVNKLKLSVLENDKLKADRDLLSSEQIRLNLEHDKLVLESENLKHKIMILEDERERLLDTQQDMPSEVQAVINERIEILNSLLASHITSNEQFERTYTTWVESLVTHTEVFMNNNRLAFQGSHPRFIQYLINHGLTKDEINYVCLYAIGLKGKEVGSYIKKPGHVNISSTIRKKLGLDKHETNIGIYVKRLLQSL